MMREIQINLDRLPQSFSDDPQTKLLALCSDFASELSKHANGNQKHPEFLQGLHKRFRELTGKIAKTRPTFDIPTKVNILGLPALAPLPGENNRSEGKKAVDGWNHFITKLILVMPLKRVREVITEKSIRELPGIIPFTVHEHFIDSFISKWKSICLDSFEDVEDLLKDIVEKLCTEYFGRFRTCGFLHEIK
jgi:hypothetical protein